MKRSDALPEKILCGSARRFASGFTLLELMIAALLGLGVLASALAIFADGYRGSRFKQQARLVQENGRAALELISRDLRMAGYTGINVRPSQIDYSAIDSQTTGCGEPGSVSDYSQPVAAFSNRNPFSENCIPAGNYLPGTDMLVVRRAADRPVTVSALGKNQAYLYTSLQTGRGFVATTDGRMDPDAEAAITGNHTAIYPLSAMIYHIRPCTDTSAGTPGICDRGDDEIPTLVREKAGPVRSVAEPLVEAVESLRVLAGMDTTTPRDYAVNNYVTPDMVSDWSRVVSIRVLVTARSAAFFPGLANRKPSGTVARKANQQDGYLRKIFTETIYLENAALEAKNIAG